ncbi:MAG: hypothetical protein AAGG55_05680 [Pseudomonadota bacterium]
MSDPGTILSIGFARPGELVSSVLSIADHFGERDGFDHWVFVDRARTNSMKEDRNKATIDVAHLLLEEGVIDRLIVRDENYGTARNVVESVTSVLSDRSHVFVMEDDLTLAASHVNASRKLMSFLGRDGVAAYSTYVNRNSSTNPLFTSRRFSSQAWGTAKYLWDDFDLDAVRRHPWSTALERETRRLLGSDFPSLWRSFVAGSLDSWAVPWNMHNFLSGRVCLYPNRSMVNSVGHSQTATRTAGVFFKHDISHEPLELDYEILKPSQFDSYITTYSRAKRAKRQLRSKLANLAWW